MKNVVMFGVGRSGKSTLAARLQKELGFENASVDYMRCLYYTLYPEKKIPDIRPVMRDITPMLDWQLGRFVDYNTRDVYGVMEGVMFKEFLETVDRDKHLLIGMGFPSISPEQKLENLLLYETPADWTHKHTKERKMQECIDGVKFSHDIKKICDELGCLFFDTSFDREKVLDRAFKYISEYKG